MKRRPLAIVVAASTLVAGAVMAQSDSRLTARFPGACVKWIHVAEPIIQREKLDLEKYTVTVVEGNDIVTVNLTSLDCPEERTGRGSCGRYPGFVVEVSKKDMHVIRSNYIR